MTARKLTPALTRALTICLLFTIAPLTTWAQDDGGETEYVTVRLHTVLPGQNAAWESLMKERRDAEEAAGRSFRRVFERIRGSGNGYLILHPDLDMGTTDVVPDISPTWGERLDSTVASSTVLTLQTYPEITANLDEWLKNDTDMLRVRLRTTAPGNRQAYHDWQAKELAPAIKKDGGILRGGRIILGGNSNTWVRMYIVKDWAQLSASGSNDTNTEFQKMIARGDAITTTKENYLFQYRADLSFRNE